MQQETRLVTAASPPDMANPLAKRDVDRGAAAGAAREPDARAGRLTFLRPQTVVVLMFADTMLGGFGGWLARGRAER